MCIYNDYKVYVGRVVKVGKTKFVPHIFRVLMVAGTYYKY